MSLKKITSVFIIMILVFLSIPFQQTKAAAQSNQQPTVTVKLVNYLGNVQELTINFTGHYLLNSTIPIESGKTYRLRNQNGKLIMFDGNKEVHSFNEFTFVPSVYNEQHLIRINNRPYLGTMRFIPEGNIVRPINIVPMEDYLKGVVPSEMPASWSLEALKAQTVAARTYAASQGSRVMDDTINFQVYAGYEWHPNSTRAVNETSGQTLMHNGRYISAVFSSSNGGRTESNANAWGGAILSYLPIKEDPYDAVNPWNITMNKTQIDLTNLNLANPELWWATTREKDATISNNMKAWLASNGYANSEIKLVSIPTLKFSDQLTTGGRVKNGDITVQFFVKSLATNQFVRNADGTLKLHTIEWKNTTAQRIRAIIGINLFKSYLIDNVKETSSTIVVNGRGWGHGVGMSQWGAKRMADSGFKVHEIVQFYYPGTTLTPFLKYEEAVQTEKAPLEIKNTKIEYDSKHDQVVVQYQMNKDAVISITVRDSSHRIVATLIKDTNRKAGELAQYWTVTTIPNGTYSFTIDGKDIQGEIAAANIQYKLEKIKPVVSQPAPAAVKPKASQSTTSTTTKTPALAKAGTRVTGKVQVKTANIRKSATTKSAAVGKVKQNQNVNIIGRTGQFYQVQSGKVKGFIHVDLLKINQKLADKNNVAVIVNGQVVKLDDKAIVRNKTMYLPFKGTAESLKLKYQWNKTNNNVTLKDSRTNIALKVNSKSATVNKKKLTLTNQPLKINSKVYVSLKTVNETTKAKTYWDSKANIVWVSN